MSSAIARLALVAGGVVAALLLSEVVLRLHAQAASRGLQSLHELQPGPPLFIDLWHPSARGHEVAAGSIRDGLVARGLLPAVDGS